MYSLCINSALSFYKTKQARPEVMISHTFLLLVLVAVTQMQSYVLLQLKHENYEQNSTKNHNF